MTTADVFGHILVVMGMGITMGIVFALFFDILKTK